MTDRTAALRALDAALEAVERAGRRQLQTRDGGPAVAELATLREALTAQRDRVREGGALDRDGMASLVRDVARWTPDSEIQLLAALGAVIQAAR